MGLADGRSAEVGLGRVEAAVVGAPDAVGVADPSSDLGDLDSDPGCDTGLRELTCGSGGGGPMLACVGRDQESGTPRFHPATACLAQMSELGSQGRLSPVFRR